MIKKVKIHLKCKEICVYKVYQKQFKKKRNSAMIVPYKGIKNLVSNPVTTFYP